MIGEPPVFLGSVHVRDAESCLISTILGGGGASGTSRKRKTCEIIRMNHKQVN